MKKSSLVICFLVFVMACSKERYVFTLKAVELNSYVKTTTDKQNLYIKIVKAEDSSIVLAQTGIYPSDLSLPFTFAVAPNLELHLYKSDHIAIELWGDISGRIASSTLSMGEYKIHFPIDMETKNANVSFAVMGTW